jgi:hypothetical protein
MALQIVCCQIHLSVILPILPFVFRQLCVVYVIAQAQVACEFTSASRALTHFSCICYYALSHE